MSQKTIHGPWCCARMASPKRLAATEDVSLALVQSAVCGVSQGSLSGQGNRKKSG